MGQVISSPAVNTAKASDVTIAGSGWNNVCKDGVTRINIKFNKAFRAQVDNADSIFLQPETRAKRAGKKDPDYIVFYVSPSKA